jgi:hypothetical protein
MFSDHPVVIEKGLRFLRDNDLWPGREYVGPITGVYTAPDNDARKLEEYLDALPQVRSFSGAEFQLIMNHIVRVREQDSGKPVVTARVVKKVIPWWRRLWPF